MLRAMDQALVNAAAAGKTKHVGWVINNMTGGAGAISWEYSKKANPDGYTLLGVSSTFLTAPLLNDMDVSYEDFTPIAMLLIDPQVIAVPANSPYQTFDDLIKDAKATPGTQSWAAGVAGSLAFVGGLEIQKKFDCKVNLVPFEGGADAAASLMGGHLTAAISEFVEVREAAEGGLVKILAAFNPLSAKGFEDVPTMAELGYPDIEITKIRGILGPKGMDPAVVDAVIEQINVMLQEDSFKQYIDSNALIMDLRTKDDFYKIMEEQTALLKESLAS
jgi:putative tricarboxylic transport membrane protein